MCRKDRQHKTDPNGRLSHNRRGTRLCMGFQSKQCSTIGMICHDDSMHQCNKCWSPGHGGDSCTNAGAKAPGNVRPKGAGKGGDKGGRKGSRSQL